MTIQLIEGNFNSSDALEIITQMIHVKIKFHEGKINNTSSEEDIKMREKRIKELQKDLFEVRKHIEQQGSALNLHAEITL